MPAGMRDFALEAHFSRWEFAARYNMAGSDAECLTIGELLDLAGEPAQALTELGLGYTETWGAPALRAAIAETYDAIAAEDVLCFAGAEEALFTAMHRLLDAGDHAIVITPNYQAAETVPLSLCDVSPVALGAENDWALDLDALRAALRPNTRLISVNFPNNPTGMLPSREQFDAIVALCRERGIWLFCDEVYRMLERDPARRLPQAADVYERGVSLNVMSKAYGLAGLRIGWLACRDRDFLGRCERFKHYLSICNAAPSEHLACLALRHRAAIVERNRALIDANLRHLEALFADFAELFDWREPDGGCIGFMRYKGADGVEAFARRLVEEAGVLLLPASVFRSELAATPADRVRIGFGRRDLPEAASALRNWLTHGTRSQMNPSSPKDSVAAPQLCL